MTDKKNLNSISYIFGVLSVIFAFFVPGAGLVLGIIGLIQSNKIKSQKAKRLNIIGIILSVLFFILELILFSSSLGGNLNLFPLA
ncbi:DUF4190 domain-containing protein [Candidatus Pacearchaeota archaeon]|nr:DUF4190 domain-containing protein [Candidatus Pacearchaeota archaeon]